MKHSRAKFFIYSSLVALLLLGQGCSDEQQNTLSVSTGKVELEAGGGTFTISLQANVPVNVEIEPGITWLKVGDTTTRALTETKLAFSADENTGKSSRQAVITLTGGGLTKLVTVYQAGADPVLALRQQEYLVGSEGETIEVEVHSNVNYEVQLPAVDWLMEAKNRSVSAYTHYFTVVPNDTYDIRTAEIVFVDKENGGEEKVTVNQMQKNAIVVAQSEYTVEATGGKLDFTVNANVDFTVEISVDWIRQIDTRGLTEVALSFDVTKNNTNEQREATITLQDGTLKQVITVIQKGILKPYIHVSQKTFNVSCSSTHIGFTIDSNVDVSLFSGDDWCCLVRQDDKEYTFEIKANETLVEREARILIENKEYGLSETITILQEAFVPRLEILSKEIVTGAESATVLLKNNVSANIDYTITIKEVDWMNLYEDLEQMHVFSNDTGTDRQAEITISNEEYSMSRSFILRQKKYRFLDTTDENRIMIPAEKGNCRIRIHADQEVKAYTQDDWVTVQVANDAVELNYEENVLDEERYGYIFLEIGKFIRKEISLIQVRADAPEGNIDEIIHEEW